MMSEVVAQCNRHITELTTRIEDMEASAGSGLIAADEFVRLLEQTRESWHERKGKLLKAQSV
jgi:hypothetical protein